jgi:hypothetical protein
VIELVRDRLGFQGAVVTDDLDAPSIMRGRDSAPWQSTPSAAALTSSSSWAKTVPMSPRSRAFSRPPAPGPVRADPAGCIDYRFRLSDLVEERGT